MFFRQVINEDLGCASYVIACGGEAAVIDPQYDIQPYLDLARDNDFVITRVFETHNHADHVSGHGRLVAATGATIHAPKLGEASFEHTSVTDGDEIAFGNVRVHVVATPGHRPEHVAYAVTDLGRADAPWALITGDSLLVGDIARPDLAVEADEGSAGLLDSMQRLLDYDDHVEVWPGHIGGSLCGSARLSGKSCSTVGFEKIANPLLAIDDAAELQSALMEGVKPKPPNFAHIVARNGGELHDYVANVRPLEPMQLVVAARGGAVIIDTRPSHDYDESHVPSSLSVAADDAGVGTRASWLLEPTSRVVLVTGDGQDPAEMAMRLHAVGIDDIVGWLDGGMAGWKAAGLPVGSAKTLNVQEFAERYASEPDIAVLDVRDPDEYVAGHLPGAVNIPYYELQGDRLDAVRAMDGTIAVICLSGARAGQAVSMLEQAGITNTLHVDNGGVTHLPSLGIELELGAAQPVG